MPKANQGATTIPKQKAPPKTIEDYAKEREQAGQTTQVANAPPPPPPVPEKNPFSERDPAAHSAAAEYTDWNRSAGVQPEDEIAGEFMRGNYKRGALNLLYGAPGWSAMKSYLKGADPIYSGGSADALAANRGQYDAGILGGQDMTGRGEGISMYGADAAGAAGALGMNAALTGMGRENQALGSSILAANQQVGSLAEAQQRAATDAQARQMQAMAASARGGNAAAALRAAGAQGSQNAMQTSQLLAQQRLAEEQTRREGIVKAQQYAAQQYGNRAATGLGAANTAASTIGGIGSNVMGAGGDQTKTFVDAELQLNKDQMEQDRKNAEEKGGFWKKGAGIIGSFFGKGGQ